MENQLICCASSDEILAFKSNILITREKLDNRINRCPVLLELFAVDKIVLYIKLLGMYALVCQFSKHWNYSNYFHLFVVCFCPAPSSLCPPPSYSFTNTVSELTRGSSTGAGSGKGHVKSASVSSPGPSAADNGTASTQQSDSLGARYKSHSHTYIHTYTQPQLQPQLQLQNTYTHTLIHTQTQIPWLYSATKLSLRPGPSAHHIEFF